jgi:hypothetical protein
MWMGFSAPTRWIPGSLARHNQGIIKRPWAFERNLGTAPECQTVSNSRAPVLEDGWRSLDMARASI